MSPSLLAFLDASSFVLGVAVTFNGSSDALVDLVAVAGAVAGLTLHATGMYGPLGAGARASFLRSVTSVGFAVLLAWTVAVIADVAPSASQRDLPLAAGAAAVVLWRIVARRIERSLQGRQTWIVVADGDRATELAAHAKAHQDIRVVETRIVPREGVDRVLVESRPDALLVELESPIDPATWALCEDLRIAVYVSPDLNGLLAAASEVQRVTDSLVFAGRPLSVAASSQAKRVIDVCAAALLLVLLAPALLFVAGLVRWFGGPGPVVFRQTRVGLDGREFELLKFRSMVDGAEAETGAVLSEQGDPRVTTVGQFMRATRVDELPQLINVLRGEMSLVGPRPERPEFVEKLAVETPGYGLRHLVRPGVTGLAQVSAGYHTSAADKLRFDLYYMQRYTLPMDIRIVLQTAKTILSRSG